MHEGHKEQCSRSKTIEIFVGLVCLVRLWVSPCAREDYEPSEQASGPIAK